VGQWEVADAGNGDLADAEETSRLAAGNRRQRDALHVVARLKEESPVPLRPHGSLSMSRALMAAGLVDRVQVTLFPVITGQTEVNPSFEDAADFDLELARDPDARRPHARAHLPTHPPLTVTDPH
jgi:hypothetical protein